MGHEVLQVENKPARWWLGRSSWWNLSRAERSLSDLFSSWTLYRTALRWRPDAIFLTKGENIRAEVFTLLRKNLNFRLGIWYVDNPFHGKVTSYQAIRHIEKSDVYFIWSNYLVDALYSAGARRVELLPFAFDPASHPDVEIPASERKKWAADVCFVGTWDKEREAALEPLATAGIDLAIYGQAWTRYLPSDSPLRSHVRSDSIWGGDVVKAFKGAKIVLNLLRQHNWKSHNFRTMEATGIGGGALLTPWTEDQARILFDENTEILCFDGPSPNPDTVRRLLADPDRLKAISSRAKQRVFKEHLLEHRMSRVVECLTEPR